MGSATAQRNLGDLLRNNAEKDEDFKEAIQFYELAAEQGNVDSAFNLAQMYAGGVGVKQSYKKAVEWFQAAFEMQESEKDT